MLHLLSASFEASFYLFFQTSYVNVILYPLSNQISVSLGEQGWHSGESARLPPLWPGFDSWPQCLMWVEFVVGSRPCSEGFSPGSPVFLPP